MFIRNPTLRLMAAGLMAATGVGYFFLPGHIVPSYYNRILVLFWDIRLIIKFAFPDIEAFLLTRKKRLRIVLGPVMFLLLFMDVWTSGLSRLGFIALGAVAIISWGDVLFGR